MATVTGTPGDDLDANKVKGTNDWDRLFGLSGNDELTAYDGVDWLKGGPGGRQPGWGTWIGRRELREFGPGHQDQSRGRHLHRR